MKKIFKLQNFYMLMFLMGSVVAFTSCDDEDDNPPHTPVVQDMYGSYTGNMAFSDISLQDASDDSSVSEAVTAKVDNDTIYFDDFPIKNIVVSVVGDEALADKIVEAVGKVEYKIGYKPELTEKKDSILFGMDPKPFNMSVTLPSEVEGEEDEQMDITVNVLPVDGANYECKTTNLKFNIDVDEVQVGGSSIGFEPKRFDFEMKKK